MDSHDFFNETYYIFVEETSHGIQSISLVNFVKELETSFWDFVHTLFQEIILQRLY